MAYLGNAHVIFLNLSFCFFTTAGQCCTSLCCTSFGCALHLKLLTVPPCAEERGHEWVFLCLFPDFPMQLNLAMFEFNGKTGYLLKHDVLRRSDKKFDPFCDRIDTVVASTLTIKAGSQPYYCCLSLTLMWGVHPRNLCKINTKPVAER